MTSTPSESGSDRLIIRGLELRCVVGAEDWEHLMPQRVVVDIELRGDFSAAARSDNLVDAPDYRTPCIKAAKAASAAEYRLVETLADRIAEAVLNTHACITSATVAVHKPLALVGFENAKATVEVTRSA